MTSWDWMLLGAFIVGVFILPVLGALFGCWLAKRAKRERDK